MNIFSVNSKYKISGAVFDVDGTILDSMGIWDEIITDFYKKHNLTPSSGEPELLRNMTLEESIPYILDKYSLKMSVSEVESELKSCVFNKYKTEIQAKDGAVDFIKRLHASGIKIAAATSGYPELFLAAFKRLGIDKFTDAYALSSEVGVNKSNPDVYLLAASRIGISPEKCMVFEDISAGIQGAKKGGFMTCAVRDSSNLSITDALKKEADIYISSFSELYI